MLIASPLLPYSDHQAGRGPFLYARACELPLEGHQKRPRYPTRAQKSRPLGQGQTPAPRAILSWSVEQIPKEGAGGAPRVAARPLRSGRATGLWGGRPKPSPTHLRRWTPGRRRLLMGSDEAAVFSRELAVGVMRAGLITQPCDSLADRRECPALSLLRVPQPHIETAIPNP